VKYTAAGSVVITISAERISSSSSSYYGSKHTYESYTSYSSNAGGTAQYDIESQVLKQQRQQHGRLPGRHWRRLVHVSIVCTA
jgi:hypothetical protein